MAGQETSSPLSARRIGIREFRGNFSSFMRQVRMGASFIVTSHDEAVAVIQPPLAPAPQRRRPGGLRGQIWMAPDFDATPAEIIACMEGDAE